MHRCAEGFNSGVKGLMQYIPPDSTYSSQFITKHHKKTYGEIKVYLYKFLISAWDWRGRRLLLARPSNFISNKWASCMDGSLGGPQNGCRRFGEYIKAGNVRITKHWGAFVQPLLQWNSSKYYVFWVFVALGIQYEIAHEPYCHLCPLRLCNIFPHIS
jgi:hypothetical protein